MKFLIIIITIFFYFIPVFSYEPPPQTNSSRLNRGRKPSSDSKVNNSNSSNVAIPSKDNSKLQCPPPESIIYNGDAMKKIFKKGEKLQIQKDFAKCGMKLFRWDIVVVKEQNKMAISKIFGIPGDEMKLKGKRMVVNESSCKSSDNFFLQNNYKVLTKQVPKNPTKIPAHKYLILSDNDDQPTDSRVMGLIDESQIVAIVKLPRFVEPKIDPVPRQKRTPKQPVSH